jgi:SAM-dependent methyltransferase
VKAYGQDLAYIHDVGFGSFAERSTPGLLEILDQSVKPGGLVVDLGCGSGILAAGLCRGGYDVLGIDISPAMIALARRRAPEASFRRGSFLRIGLPRCAAVVSIGECLGYLFDPDNGRRALAGLFRRIYGALEPGGVLIFDVVEPGYVPRGRIQQRHWQGKDWAVLVEVEEDRERGELLRWHTSFRKVGRHYRRDEEVHRLGLFDRGRVLRRLRGIGFRVRLLRGYGQLRFRPSHVGFLARKTR